jgi:cyclopropane-fatty-acyl-phospholipid synthase
MSVTPKKSTDPAADLTLGLLQQLFKDQPSPQVSVRLWNDRMWPDDTPQSATLVLKHPGALRNMFLPGSEVGLGEAYLYDDFDVEGNLEAVFSLADAVMRDDNRVFPKWRVAQTLLRLPAHSHKIGQRGPARLKGKRHSIERDRQAVTYHYDVSGDFYALWLDQRMVYSCAYFQTPNDSLDVAQENKLDYLCRKLRLRPGFRLLDIGCGWGGLVLYATQHYGVDATGITLSQPQCDLANKRIAVAGCSDHARVLVRDYREVQDANGYDALVSVGMFEHVGAKLLPVYFTQAWNLLKPGGVFLNHGIATRATEPSPQANSFSDTYVFPDGELTPIHTTLGAAEEAGFEVRNVESLREHYALTLRHWVHRLETHHTEALQYVDEPTYRVWRLFMSGSAHSFSAGQNNVYQSLLVKPGEGGQSGLPLTRADWYAPHAQL